MVQNKYVITDVQKAIGQHIVSRIRATRSFGNVKEGDLGGYIESESNLSHNGECWVYDDATVYGNAHVERDAKVKDQATVSGQALVSDKAVVAGETRVFDRAMVYDSAKVLGMASVYNNAQVFGLAKVMGSAKVHDDAWVYGDFTIEGSANITSKTTQKPIVLSGFTYDICIMDEHISIDCQTKTFDEWRAVTREEAFAMNGRDSLRFFRHAPDTIEFLLQKYRKKDSNV